MVSHEKTPLVVRGIRKLDGKFRPSLAMAIFTMAGYWLEPNSMRLTFTVKELAKQLGAHASHVNSALNGLIALQIFRREPRPREHGQRGAVHYDYFINPAFMWRGDLPARKAEASDSEGQTRLHVVSDRGLLRLAVPDGAAS